MIKLNTRHPKFDIALELLCCVGRGIENAKTLKNIAQDFGMDAARVHALLLCLDEKMRLGVVFINDVGLFNTPENRKVFIATHDKVTTNVLLNYWEIVNGF